MDKFRKLFFIGRVIFILDGPGPGPLPKLHGLQSAPENEYISGYFELFITTVHIHPQRPSISSSYTKVSFRENFTLLPDQIQFLNPIMVLILIPTFNYALYPLFAKVGFANIAFWLVCFFSNVLIGWLKPYKSVDFLKLHCKKLQLGCFWHL